MRGGTSIGVMCAAVAVMTSCSAGDGSSAARRIVGTESEVVRSSAAALPPTPTPIRTGPFTTGPGVLPGERPPLEHGLSFVHSDAGGYAFATYFMQALSWSIATNDGWLIHENSSTSCDTCKRYLAELDSFRLKHQTQRGGRPTVKSSHLLLGTLPFGAEVGVDYVIDESAAVVTPSNKTVPKMSGRHTRIYLVWDISRWIVREEASS